MKRRALVSQTRMPESDRDRGSQRVDAIIRWLLDDGWSVTFLAQEGHPDEWHARRLRQEGVATYAGYEHAEKVVASGDFDLAILAFWKPASSLLPVIRAESPTTRVVVDSIDVHFLREARRRFGVDGQLDPPFGELLIDELNTYRAADAVLAVSVKEAKLLADFLGGERVHCLPLSESFQRSTSPFESRRGMLFVGNFRHLPNGEAVEYLCRDIVPRLDPALLAAQPLTVIGNRLDDGVRAHAAGLSDVRMIGWVPSIIPYLERSRICVVPLLHGAGVKGKVIQSLMLGTPVVTTTIGAEGLGLQHGEHALIAETAGDLAAAISRLLTDAVTWNRLADAGWSHVRATYCPDTVQQEFRRIIEDVVARPPVGTMHTDPFRHSRQRALTYGATTTAVREIVPGVTEPGTVVLVVSKGDEELVDIEGRAVWHFPQGADGTWAGYHPADSESAIRHLDALRARGARYLVFPDTAFWWLHHYHELASRLDDNHRRIHVDDHLIVFELSDEARRGPVRVESVETREHVLVIGHHAEGSAGPSPALVAELARSERFAVTQRWSDDPVLWDHEIPDTVDWILDVDDVAILRPGFVDNFLGLVQQLGADRAQPAHTGGPAAGPPVTERLRGCVARQVPEITPLPVTARRAGSPPSGPVAIVDAVPVGLAHSLAASEDPMAYSQVLDAFSARSDGVSSIVRRACPPPAPRISVLIATFNRSELLADCLEGFCGQRLETSSFEVVVVDDGSTDLETEAVLERFADRLPLVWARIEHSGRSAAKNLAVLLARGDLVLFFDDDDRPTPSLLETHLQAHDACSDEGVAVLGHTDWAPELAITPLMHYLTEVDKMLFSYGNLEDGQELDWKGFWEGRISCRRSLLLRHGLHDQRLPYSIDVELGMRLVPHGLRVVYRRGALSYMARSVTFDDFCRRLESKGRAQAIIASLHPEAEVRRYLKVDEAQERWKATRGSLADAVARVRALEAEVAHDRAPEDPRLAELHRLYREVFFAFNAKGVVEAAQTNGRLPSAVGTAAEQNEPAVTVRNGAPTDPERPILTVTIPVWSHTPELADMAVRTVERVWETARVPTEVIVIDNGSPYQRPLRAEIHRFDENRGVATAWNTGITMAHAPVVGVLNSDCLVEAGWDEALVEAASTGRRIAFPYTDHGDGLGFRQPDQAGTAGWCFALTLDLYREIGPFDERFSPAYCEDTDYWHRAWELGVELSPVPAARVIHARRTSAAADPHWEWLLQGHRYKYGWKHGVDPLRAPPYYKREIVEYHCRGRTPLDVG